MSLADVKKTLYFLKRNGWRKTWNAVRERLEERKQPAYEWTGPTEAELEAQKKHWEQEAFSVTFSIVTPAYRTPEKYLREMIDSLKAQTYPKWELILADATEDDSVERVVCGIQDLRVHYFRLTKNGGIAANTNEALKHVTGEYVGLLDHDDLLTENALYEMAAQIEGGRKRGREIQMLYSDEDKCNGDRTAYFEPNKKEDFNLDLLLSNNYICHFLVMKEELIQSLKFRTEYDGSQDYDLVLRAAAALLGNEEAIAHIPKVLYHWRCHSASTAENPHSKQYAYDAGRRAVQDFVNGQGWKAGVVESAHVGFYALRYEGDIFQSRPDVGAIGGRVVRKGKIVGGRMTQKGSILYENLPKQFSGYMHRAVLQQEAEAVDIRNILVKEECRELFRQVTGVPYRTVRGGECFDVSLLPPGCDVKRLSLDFCAALRSAGYRILYLPE